MSEGTDQTAERIHEINDGLMFLIKNGTPSKSEEHQDSPYKFLSLQAFPPFVLDDNEIGFKANVG